MYKQKYARTKRVLDFIGALFALVLFFPVILIASLFVRIFLGKPVIFKQSRPGLNEQIFTLYKFRSMKEVDEQKGLITDEERLGKFGRLLRASSIDELPSLWNVLKGEMSFVGPRPLLVEYLPLYSEKERERHSVKPGITGLAQVSGRNNLTWDEKFALDYEYVNDVSLCLDLKIILHTLATVTRAANINSPGSATSPKLNREVSNEFENRP